MDYLSGNPYQLLFVDDDTNDLTVGEETTQQCKGQKKIKQKKIKSMEINKTLSISKSTTKMEVCNAKEQQHLKLQQQLQQQLQLEQKQQQQLQQQLQQTMMNERVYRERIINNSNRYYGGYGRGYGDGGRPITNTTYNEQPKQQQLINQNENNEDEVEDESKYITVEEWRSMNEERAKPIYNIRKPGEGEANKPDWKKMVVLQKKIPSISEEDNVFEYDATMYPQRVGRQQRIVDIDFKFKDDRRRNRYRTTWTARSYTNQSVSEGGKAESINMNYESEFPALG